MIIPWMTLRPVCRFRMTDGKPIKRYTDDIPLWAQNIIG
jgi:hypothetical protein